MDVNRLIMYVQTCYLQTSDIKHRFFQPCDKELLVIVHIHLKTPIMIGKKEATCEWKPLPYPCLILIHRNSGYPILASGNRQQKHHYCDEDEIEME